MLELLSTDHRRNPCGLCRFLVSLCAKAHNGDVKSRLTTVMLASFQRRACGLVLAILAAVCLGTIGCDGADASRSADCDDQVLILAAASTQDALEQIAEVLRHQGGPRLTISPAGSNALAQQIIAGAPGDLFLSANPAWADEVVRHGHAAQVVPLLSGRLVLVVPKDNPASVHHPSDLLDARVKRVALAGEHVPAGMYGEQALRRHAVYERLAEAQRIVRGQSVRFTLAYVERNEVDAGIVYASDAVATNVQVVFTFDEADHEPIVYPLVLLQRGEDRPAARRVFEFLQSPAAGATFEQHGFRWLTGPVGEGG